MANEMGTRFKLALLTGELFNSQVIDVGTPNGTNINVFSLWSSSANRSNLLTGNTTGTTYTTGQIETQTYSGSNPTISSDAIVDKDDIAFTGVSGANCTYLIWTFQSGSDPQSMTVILIDTATGLPFTPTGGDVTVVWDNGTNKIFKL